MENQRIRERFDQLCRFCLSEEDCIVIFTGEYELNERLSKCLDILLAKVDEEDGFPNKICLKCVSCIDQFVDFESTCVKSYEILGSARDSPLDDEDSAVAHSIKVEERKLDSLEAQDFVEEYCDVPKSNDEAGPMDTDSFAEEETNIERLEEEEQISIIDENVVVHEEGLLEDADDDEIDESNESTSYNLSAEQQQMLDAAMQAPTCGFIERGSRKIPLVECIYCKNVYRGRNTLKKHLRIHLNIKDYQCAHCPRTFTDRSSLRIHQGRHTGKAFTCSHCNKTYFSQNELRQHLTMQHLERKYTCDTCQRKFPSKTILNDHYRVHLPDRPFVCKHCGAGFKRNRNLIRHLQLHQKTATTSKSTVKLHSLDCPVCSAPVNQPSVLLNHLREQHINEFESIRTGSHHCPKCDIKEFNDLEECLNHQQIHYTNSSEAKTVNLYNCVECGKKFKTRSFATKHLSVHSGESSFICEIEDCRMMYKLKSNFERHQEELHDVYRHWTANRWE